MITIRNNYAGEKSIDIDINKTVTVSLRKEEYDELIEKLELSMAEKLKASDAYCARVKQKSIELNKFIKDITEVFYDICDDVGLRKGITEIEPEKLYEMLDKHSRLLGFE